MGRSGQFNIFKARQSKPFNLQVFAKYRQWALASGVAIFTVLLIYISLNKHPGSEVTDEQREGERVLSQSVELTIGNSADGVKSSLSLQDSVQMVSKGMLIKHGFMQYFPQTITGGDGRDIVIPEPAITSLRLDGSPYEEHSVSAAKNWWNFKFGSATTTLDPGTHEYLLNVEIPEIELYEPSGKASLTLPVIAPIATYIDQAQAAINFPVNANANTVEFKGWIGAIDQEGTVSSEKEEISGSQQSSAGSLGRRIIFTAPRRLKPWEGMWVQISW